MNQIIWNNSDVKCNNKILMLKKWKDAGIVYMSDVASNNRFMNLTELRQIVRCPRKCLQFAKTIISHTKDMEDFDLKK